jgi:hypothetical protein
MNVGWYVVYVLMCSANGLMCAEHGFTVDQWQFWAWSGIIALAFISGANYRRRED